MNSGGLGGGGDVKGPSSGSGGSGESPYIRISTLHHQQPNAALSKKEQIYSTHLLVDGPPNSGRGLVSTVLQVMGVGDEKTPLFGGATLSLPPASVEGGGVDLSAEGEDEPFLVTVRSSPAREKLSKSPSGSFLGPKSPKGRLALYRSNSSLDLLDRDNYLLHNPSSVRQRLGGAGSGQSPRASLPSAGSHSHAHQELQQHNRLAGCFPRRKDFGSHGSIDVLAAAPTSSHLLNLHHPPHLFQAQFSKVERSGSVGNAASFFSLMNSSANPAAVRMNALAAASTEGAKGDERGVTGEDGVVGDKKSSKEGSSSKDSTSSSPRLRLRKLWEKDSSKGDKGSSKEKPESQGIFRKLKSSKSSNPSSSITTAGNHKSLPAEGLKFDLLGDPDVLDGAGCSSFNKSDKNSSSSASSSITLRHGGNGMEERFRRRVLAHYDCQSVSANISYAARLRGILSKRRNTTTGASAASLATKPQLQHQGSLSSTNHSEHMIPSSQPQQTTSVQPSSLDSIPSPDPDPGDDKSNPLVLSCPYFRNEIGGERERLVSLGVPNPSSVRVPYELRGCWEDDCHRGFHARRVSLLDSGSGGTVTWNTSACPFSPNSNTIQDNLLEAKDTGATYYRTSFHGQDHENWLGLDEKLGPLAVSVKKERIEETDKSKNLYRLIVRSSELNTVRGSILEESIPNVKLNSTKVNAKELIEFLFPEVQLSCLKLGAQGLGTDDQLLKLDEQGLTNRHKVGIMYCKAGQSTEEEMYNNESAGGAFNEFLDLIGQRVRLKGFDKYTGGLDNKDDSTGLSSVYSNYQDCEVIFHVSTLLPFTPNNRQQLMRKRHIGNDIVTIVFQEPGALPFTPKNIRSQFQHVFIIVRAINPCSDTTHYSVSVSRSREVPLFGPPIPVGGKFPKNRDFVNFLLAKVINAENATYRSEKFTTMATRTRQEYLKDLVANYSTNTLIDPRPKFSMLQFGGSKKKELTKPRYNGSSVVKGGLSWSVSLEEIGAEIKTEAYLVLSLDSLVLIDYISRECIFAIPCSSILGWNAFFANRLRIFYHVGECIALHLRESSGREELSEIVTRLNEVSMGTETVEFCLRRSEGTQLGFHVQQDGVVTEVEPTGYAAKAGLKQGSRLVEICQTVVASLSQDEMIEMLKTSTSVALVVIPPHSENSPRRGCDMIDCLQSQLSKGRAGLLSSGGGDYGDYENVHLNGKAEGGESPSHPHNHRYNKMSTPYRKKYEPKSSRGFSPPRSSNSSGYGTGSSSKSFSSASTEPLSNPADTNFVGVNGSGSVEEGTKWSGEVKGSGSPPPIPARAVHTQRVMRSSPIKTPNNREQSSPLRTHRPLDPHMEFFRRSSPHHNSFHTRLTPSRSHDMLTLKNLYGLNQPLRPFPTDKTSYPSSPFGGSPHMKLSREHSSLGISSVGNGEAIYTNNNNNNVKSPLYGTAGVNAAAGENTVRGKVTYLTDFPLTHSISTEQVTTIGVTPHKDADELKNERVAALKSAYLDKHRNREKLSTKIMNLAPTIPLPTREGTCPFPKSEFNEHHRPRPLSLPLANPVKHGSSEGVKLRGGTPGNNNNRLNGSHRNSTLQEDLIRLISPEFLVPPSSNDSKSSSSSPSKSSFNGDREDVELYSTRNSYKNYDDAATVTSSNAKRPSGFDRRIERRSLLLEPHDNLNGNDDLSPEHSALYSTATAVAANNISNGRIGMDASPLNPVGPWLKGQETTRTRSVSPGGVPLENVLNLEARVSQLEAELRKEQESKEVLAETIVSLQQENLRLQQESSTTQQELKEINKFKQLLLNSFDPNGPEQ